MADPLNAGGCFLAGISASFGDYTLQFQWTPISKKGPKCLYPVTFLDPYKHLERPLGFEPAPVLPAPGLLQAGDGVVAKGTLDLYVVEDGTDEGIALKIAPHVSKILFLDFPGAVGAESGH